MNHQNSIVTEVQYSVIIPVFNSEKSLEELFERIERFFKKLNCSFEVVFVDDGSRDKSWEILKKLKQDNPINIKAIRLSKNFGQHIAVFCGLKHISGGIIITMDDDLQNPPEEIAKLIHKYDETSASLVYGVYSTKKHGWLRNIGSWIIKKCSKFFSGSHGEGSSFRLFTREVADQIISQTQSLIFIDELLLWYASDIQFVEVLHERRKYGNSGYSKFKLFSFAVNLLMYYTTFPLKLMINFGFFSSLISFLIGSRYIYKKIFLKVAVPGYTSLIVTILFSTGLIILSLGIIGEYLLRIYLGQNKKPPYNIRQSLL